MNDKYSFEPRKRARRRALQALYQWQITEQDTADILRQFREAQDFSRVDEAHFEKLLRGVVAEKPELDERLKPFLDRPIEQIDQMERVVLRIGTFELLHFPEMPYRVILNECVDLAHRFGSEQGHGYVNAVLDKAAREWRPEETGSDRSGG